MKRALPVPAMTPCPDCGLPVEAGASPFGLAWHSCDFVKAGRVGQAVEVTFESVEQAVLARIREEAANASAKDLIGLLQALRDLRPAAPGGAGDGTEKQDGDILGWLAAGSATRPPGV